MNRRTAKKVAPAEGPASNGINVLNEDVTVTFAGFTQTILAGSFVRKDDKFEFKAADGASGITKIEIFDDGRYRVKAKYIELGALDLNQPVEFSLQIGNDLGSLLISFDHKGHFKLHNDDA